MHQGTHHLGNWWMWVAIACISTVSAPTVPETRRLFWMLVMVASSHEDDPTAKQDILNGQQQLSTCERVAPFGIVRALGLLNRFVSAYPAAEQPVVKAHFSQTRFCGTWYDESAAWEQSTSQLRAARLLHSLGNLPLVVITHGKDLDASWRALQNDLASLSSTSTH